MSEKPCQTLAGSEPGTPVIDWSWSDPHRSHCSSDSPEDRFYDAITPRQVKRKRMGGDDTGTPLEIFPQQRPRPMKPGFDRFRSDIQTPARLGH